MHKIYCLHGRFYIGDRHNFKLKELIRFEKARDRISLPLWMYDHSFQFFKVVLPLEYQLARKMRLHLHKNPFANQAPFWHWDWDSGQVGVITITKAEAREMFGWTRITKKRLFEVYDYLVKQIEAFDRDWRGESED